MLLESLLAKLAAAGLATKAAAGGAAVVVAASAAGAADALPTPAQDTFDRLVVEEVELEEDETLEVQEVTEDGPAEGTFGERVSADANGEDGEPGVDGRQIACEASEGRSGTCEGERLEGEGPEDGPEEGTFGDRVSSDATGESDGEPGVDGQEISDEARAMNPGAGEEGADNAPASAGDETDDDGDDEGGPEGTPGEAAANANRPSDQG